MALGMEIESYKKTLINVTNSCGLPIGSAFYVAKDFLRDLEKSYIESLEEEAKEAQAEEASTEKKNEIVEGEEVC